MQQDQLDDSDLCPSADPCPSAEPCRSAEPRRSAEMCCDKALDLIDAGDSQTAIHIFRESLVLDPTMLEALHGLIRALQNTGQLEEAIAVAHQLIALDPDDALAHTSLSILYQHYGMIAEAEAEGTRARILDWKQQLRQDPKPLTDL